MPAVIVKLLLMLTCFGLAATGGFALSKLDFRPGVALCLIMFVAFIGTMGVRDRFQHMDMLFDLIMRPSPLDEPEKKEPGTNIRDL